MPGAGTTFGNPTKNVPKMKTSKDHYLLVTIVSAVFFTTNSFPFQPNDLEAEMLSLNLVTLM